MGAYTAFLDVALGFGTPALGLIASGAGLGAAFLASALASLGAASVALRLLYAPAFPSQALGRSTGGGDETPGGDDRLARSVCTFVCPGGRDDHNARIKADARA
jgi:hypothetical protein